MSSIKKLTYMAWGILDGNIEISSESRFTYRQIKEAIKSAVALAVRDDKFLLTNIEDSSKYGSDSFSQVYEGLDVKLDIVSKQKYIDLPCELIPTHDGRQVSIYPNVDYDFNEEQMFLPITRQEAFINRHQSSLPDASMFYVSGRKRVIFTDGGKQVNQSKLNAVVKLAIPDDDDADLNAPNYDFNKIVFNACQTLNPQIKPLDNALDGVPNN